MLGRVPTPLLVGICMLGAGCVFWFDPLKRLGPAVVNHSSRMLRPRLG